MSKMLTAMEAAMTAKTRNLDVGALVKPEVSMLWRGW